MTTNREVIEEDLQEIINSNLEWERFYNKTILISGASGFLAAYIVEVFLKLNILDPNANIKIIGLVRNREKALRRFSNYFNSKYLELIVQDVNEVVTTKSKIHFIIHAASQASPKFYGVDPVGTISANTIGTSSLLNLAKLNKVEGFLYFSSSEVYGSLPESLIPTSEGDFGSINPTNVRSCYSEGKRAGETICISYYHQYSIPIKIVRPFHTYGPGMDLDDGRVYADFVKDIVIGNNIEMKSDGKAIRAFCYISDATIAFLKVLLEGESGQAYNVGNDNCITTIVDLAEKLVSLFPEKNLVVNRINQTNSNYLNSAISVNIPVINKIKSLGWSPQIGIEEGFIKTIKYYLK